MTLQQSLIGHHMGQITLDIKVNIILLEKVTFELISEGEKEPLLTPSAYQLWN